MARTIKVGELDVVVTGVRLGALRQIAAFFSVGDASVRPLVKESTVNRLVEIILIADSNQRLASLREHGAVLFAELSRLPLVAPEFVSKYLSLVVTTPTDPEFVDNLELVDAIRILQVSLEETNVRMLGEVGANFFSVVGELVAATRESAAAT